MDTLARRMGGRDARAGQFTQNHRELVVRRGAPRAQDAKKPRGHHRQGHHRLAEPGRGRQLQTLRRQRMHRVFRLGVQDGAEKRQSNGSRADRPPRQAQADTRPRRGRGEGQTLRGQEGAADHHAHGRGGTTQIRARHDAYARRHRRSDGQKHHRPRQGRQGPHHPVERPARTDRVLPAGRILLPRRT